MMLSWFFGLAAVAIGIAIAFFVCIYLPMFIYIIPYRSWIDRQKQQYNLPKQLESDAWLKGTDTNPEAAAGAYGKYLLRNTANATKLYRSWLTKKPHGITKF